MKFTNKDKFNSKLLYEEKKKKETIDKLSKFQKEYDKFEKGLVKPDELISFITKNLELKVSDKLQKLIKSPGQDNKSYKNIIKNLEFLNNNNTEYKQSTNKLNKDHYNTTKDAEKRKELRNSM